MNMNGFTIQLLCVKSASTILDGVFEQELTLDHCFVFRPPSTERLEADLLLCVLWNSQQQQDLHRATDMSRPTLLFVFTRQQGLLWLLADFKCDPISATTISDALGWR